MPQCNKLRGRPPRSGTAHRLAANTTTIFIKAVEPPPMDGPSIQSEPQKVLPPKSRLPSLTRSPSSSRAYPPPPVCAPVTELSPQSKDSLLQTQASLGAWLEGRVHTLQECVHTLQRELCTSDEERRRLLALNAELLRDAQVRDQLCKVQGRELWRLRQILTGVLPNLSLDPPPGTVKETRLHWGETGREGQGSVRGMLESAERRMQKAGGNVQQKGPESGLIRLQEQGLVRYDEPFKLSPVPLERTSPAIVWKSSESRAPERRHWVGMAGRGCEAGAIKPPEKLSECSEQGKLEQGEMGASAERGVLRRSVVVEGAVGKVCSESGCSKDCQAEVSLPQQTPSVIGASSKGADLEGGEPSLCPASEKHPPGTESSPVAGAKQSNPAESTEDPVASVAEPQGNAGSVPPGSLLGSVDADSMLAGRLAPSSGRRSSGIAPDMVFAMMQLAEGGQAILSPLGKEGLLQATRGRNEESGGDRRGNKGAGQTTRGGEKETADAEKVPRAWEGREKEGQGGELRTRITEETGEQGKALDSGRKNTEDREEKIGGEEKRAAAMEQGSSDWAHEVCDVKNGRSGEHEELGAGRQRTRGAPEDSAGGAAEGALSAEPEKAPGQEKGDDAEREAKLLDHDAEQVSNPVLETWKDEAEGGSQAICKESAVVAQVTESFCAIFAPSQEPVVTSVSGLVPNADAQESPSDSLTRSFKASKTALGEDTTAQPSHPGSALEADLEPLSEKGHERFTRESDARQPSDLPIVRRKRTKRPLSGVRKKARTAASAFLHVSPKSSNSGSQRLGDRGRLGDPSAPLAKPALHTLPSNLDRTASKLSMDALAKAAALVERGGLASPEAGGGTAVETAKRAREEAETGGEGSSGSGDELPISKMGRTGKGGEVTRGKQRERHVASSVSVPKNAPAGVCGQGAGPKLRVPEVPRRLSTGLSGFTKLPTGPSLIRSAGLSERPGASNRAKLTAGKTLPNQPGVGNPLTPNPAVKRWSEPGDSHWSCGKTQLLGAKPGVSKPGELTRRTDWANVGVPSMNVVGRAGPGASHNLPHRLVQRPGGNGHVPEIADSAKASAEKMVISVEEAKRNGALPQKQPREVPPEKQQPALGTAGSQSGGAPKPSQPAGFHPPETGTPKIRSAVALHRPPEARYRGPDVSSTSGAFRAFASGQPNRMRPTAFPDVQPPASAPGGTKSASGLMRKGLEDFSRLVAQRPGGSFSAQDGGGPDAAPNPQMVQFWRRQEVLAKNMRLLAENDRGSVGSVAKSDGHSCPAGKKEKDAAKCLRCKCKKSKCLKLYCDCFAAGVYCSGCLCVNCLNTEENAAIVNERKAAIIRKEPNAFRIVEDRSVGLAVQRHVRGGCHCRKSQCQKEYCVCFQAGVPCTKECTCLECLNDVPRLVVRSEAQPQRA
ncbi:hypothetical protein KFL_000150330 [Klebsormidium nitens]|uniref:CRC domain-containing protein n=1 Tax=Klebsormidium nitens TaxID=105231 RepID=A0A1Y1HN22_KLENI|nr:hypothetical protein KFL_000150330 [Klebsormidium nitens]|eukprot:GAQ78579.1 hypothetical protein KFL_000150330 [Klebsormidium nitens]